MSAMIAYLHHYFSNSFQLPTFTTPFALPSLLTFSFLHQLLTGSPLSILLYSHNCFLAHPHHATTVRPSRLHFANIITICPKVIDQLV